jgi:RES domain-containing protein
MDASRAGLGVGVRQVRWAPCFRIIASRYPTIFLFERIADPTDFDALYQLEALTNPRILEELGALEHVPRQDHAVGQGASVIMAPFIYLNPAGGRFTDSSFGAFYASHTLATAIAETRHHREIFLRATREGPMELTMRSYCADVGAKFHDIRGQRAQLPDIYDPDSYTASQALGRDLRLAGSNGVVYDSVRDRHGQCIAIYRPLLVQRLRQGVHLRYVWDGERIAQIYELRPIE